jgi:hypothetical protein
MQCVYKLTDLMPTAAAAAMPHADSIMLRLRQSIHDASADLMTGWEEWQPGNPAHHCKWQSVQCDDRQHVTSM